MSRIGKLPVSIPAGVTVTLKDDVVTVKGPKGEMSQYVNPAINVTIEDGHVVLAENENAMLDNPKQKHAFHGLYRSLVHNMVVGVSEGHKKNKNKIISNKTNIRNITNKIQDVENEVEEFKKECIGLENFITDKKQGPQRLAAAEVLIFMVYIEE